MRVWFFGLSLLSSAGFGWAVTTLAQTPSVVDDATLLEKWIKPESTITILTIVTFILFTATLWLAREYKSIVKSKEEAITKLMEARQNAVEDARKAHEAAYLALITRLEQTERDHSARYLEVIMNQTRVLTNLESWIQKGGHA